MQATFVINADTASVTQYDYNLTINSGCHVGDNDYIFASPDGILLADRTVKDKTIHSKFRTGNMNFGVMNLKRISEIFMESKIPGNYIIRIIPGAQNVSVAYGGSDFLNPIHTTMLKVGKGITANYFCFEFENIDGSPWEIHKIDLILNVLQRAVYGSGVGALTIEVPTVYTPPVQGGGGTQAPPIAPTIPNFAPPNSEFPFDYTFSNVFKVATIPANAAITDVVLRIGTAWDTSIKMEIGTIAMPFSLESWTDNAPSYGGNDYHCAIQPNIITSVATDFYVTKAGTSTTGTGVVFIYYKQAT